MRIGLALGVCSLVVGCASEEPLPPSEPLARVDLRPAFAADNVDAIGVALASDGTRFVFEETRGLFRLDAGGAVEVVPMSAMPDPGPEAPLLLPVTDIVALAPNQFALTAIGDGYILDTSAMTLTQHFCYVPTGTPANLTQRTDAIAYDAVKQRLFAQPNTYNELGEFQYAQFAAYKRDTGDAIRWYNVAFTEPVTAMFAREEALVYGQGSHISRYDLLEEKPYVLEDLARYGVQSIDGMAIDEAAGALIVVDKQADAMFDIALSELAL